MSDPSPLTPEEQEALVQFRDLEIGVEQLSARLDGKLTVRVDVDRREVSCNFRLPHPGIPIQLTQIAKALVRNDSGRLSDQDLGLWSSLILMIDAYDWTRSEDEEKITEQLNDLTLIGFPGQLP